MKIFSGIQPSGVLHLGNYLGAIANWLRLQQENDCFFCVVDYHAITIKQDPSILRETIKNTTAIFLAAGIDPRKSILFVQSQLPQHTELAWILNTITKIPELERMTQFKEKAAQFRKELNLGLLDYPVLQAADILLYKTDAVPVGEDQKQHLELTRVLAKRFNYLFGNVFVAPKVIIKKEGARVMGLDDPLKKMSKTAINPYNYIALLDSPDIIKDKIKKAVTDSGREIRYDLNKKPAIANLLTIYSLLSKKSIKALEKEYASQNYAKFKTDLVEIIINFLSPLQKKYREIMKNPDYLKDTLEDGRQRAEQIAQKTLQEVKVQIGLF